MNKKELTEDKLADFSTDKRVLTLSVMAIIIGLISSAIAFGLVWLISVITNIFFFQTFSAVLKSPSQNHLGYLVALIPVTGGLIIGFMARYGSPKIRGHGIPEALEAILIGRSRIEPKVALLKPVSSAISIGTGGPFGAEGPIIMTGGAFGSIFAQFFHLSPAERKTLLVAGAAAGMSAIFAAPIAAVMLAVELLLFEWKPRSYIPVALASVTASLARVFFMGQGPLFPVIPHSILNFNQIMLAFAIGLIAGINSWLMTNLVYGIEDFFQKLPVHWMWWPAIGGLFVGIGGIIDPRVMGVGYELINSLLTGQLYGNGVLKLFILKSLVWTIALGSGTSGGVLAPLLIIGGALGGYFGQWITPGHTGLWAMIGMAAIMGGTMRAPFTAIIFTLELTHDLNTLPALLVGCMASQLVTLLLLKRSILTEKVARKGHHIVREYSVDPFDLIRVNEVMRTDLQTVAENLSVEELAKQFISEDSTLAQYHALPIVNNNNELKGIITRGDLFISLGQNSQKITVLESGSTNLVVTFPDEVLYDAVNKMLKNNIGRLLVVNRENPSELVGYLGSQEIIKARLKKHEEEHIIEDGWLGFTFK
jgi:CIC family chloride channel protein